MVADFDYNLDAPGPVSHRAMDALLAYLGIEIEESPHEMEWWAERITAAADPDPARLRTALSIKDLSRIAAFMLIYCADPGPLTHLEVDDEPTRLALHIAAGVHEGWSPDGDDLARFGRAFGTLVGSRPAAPEMLPVLMQCVGPPGETLEELPWAEPTWNTPVFAVNDMLHRAPDLHVEWLLAMATRFPDHALVLADAAARTGDTRLVQPYGIALLAHKDIAVRRAAIGRLSQEWRTDEYQDAVAALMTDPELGDDATNRLAALKDRRCLPRLAERVDRLPRLRSAHVFGAELVPHVLRRLAEPIPPKPAADLLLTAATWGDPPLLMRGEAAELVARLRRTEGAHGALIEICLRVSGWQRASDAMRAELRVLATEMPIRVRQYAQFALLEAGETDWLVPVLLKEITEHPVRTGADGPYNGAYGWRADDTACVWLGRLGAAAKPAIPVLQALFTESGEPGEARPAAAELTGVSRETRTAHCPLWIQWRQRPGTSASGRGTSPRASARSAGTAISNARQQPAPAIRKVLRGPRALTSGPAAT